MLIVTDKALRNHILKIAFPAMAEMVLYMLVGVVDVAVVGRLGAVPLAASSLGAELFFSLVMFLNALGIGASVLVAQNKGARRMEEAGHVAAQSLLLALVVGLLAGLLSQFFLPQILGLFSVENAVALQAEQYLRITLFMVPAALIYYMINSIFRGLGRTDIPMKIAIITNIVNVAGDFGLVYGLLGLPAMGVAGAALATSIAHGIGFGMALWILLSGRTELKVHFDHLTCFRPHILRAISRLGLPGLAEQLFTTLAQLASTYLLVFLGTLAFASHQVALIVESLSFMPGFGFAIAATSLVGQAVGACNRDNAASVGRACLEMVLVLMGGIGILFLVFPNIIAGLFTSDPAIIQTAGLLVRIAALEQLSIAATMVMGGILKGSGNTKTPMYISAGFTWGFRLPLMYTIIKILHLPVAYVWALFVCDWGLRTLVYTVIYRRRKWLPQEM